MTDEIKTEDNRKVGRPRGSKTKDREVQKIQKPTCPNCKSTDAEYIHRIGNAWVNAEQQTPFGDPATMSYKSLYRCKGCNYEWAVQVWTNKDTIIAQRPQR